MSGYAAPIQRLIQELGRLPGVGEKTATRLAMHILRASADDARKLAESIVDVKEKIRFCSTCFHLAEGEQCAICTDAARERDRICVVEDPDSLTAIEESGSYSGTYHVLHGALAPLDGIGPDQLHLQELVERLDRSEVREVIIATNPSVQGESTALLIMRLLKDKPVTVTRIAFGVPMGGDLRYTDKMTLAKAMEHRRGM